MLNNKCRTTLSKHTTKLQHQVHKTSALLSNRSVVAYFSIYQNLLRQSTQTSENSVAYICLLWKPPKKSNKSCYNTSWKERIHTSFRLQGRQHGPLYPPISREGLNALSAIRRERRLSLSLIWSTHRQSNCSVGLPYSYRPVHN